MSTFLELVDSLESTLGGYAQSPSQTHLTDDLAVDGLVLPVADHQKVSAGLVQIGDELLWIDSTSSSGAVVPPYGRGYQSSTASAHESGTRVVNKPSFPRVRIKATVNEVIGSLFPDLYGIGTTEIVNSGVVTTHELPADCTGVLAVTYETVGPSQAWQPVKRWNYNPSASTDTFPSGKSVDLWQGPIPGYRWRITYKKEPAALTSASDDFTAVTGLPAYCETVVFYGACYQMAGWLDVHRLQVRSVESSQRSVFVETGAAADVSKYYYALFEAEKGKAQMRLLKDYPPQIHFTRF